MVLNRSFIVATTPFHAVLGGLIYSQYAGVNFPLPFLALLATIVIAAALSGRTVGLITGTAGAIFILYSHFVGYGPDTLIGTAWSTLAASALYIGLAYWIGALRDDRDRNVREMTQYQQRLKATLATETEQRLQSISDNAVHQARLQTAVRIAGLGHFVFNSASGNCEYCSDQHAAHFGRTPEEFVNDTAGEEPELDYVHEEDRHIVFDAIRQIKFGDPVSFEYRALHKNGDVRFIHEIVEPTCDENGVVVLESGTSIDLTDLRLTEAKLRESQKLEAVGRLTAGVAHDFNNLLAVIMGNLELLETAHDAADAKELINAALNATTRGATLTRQLLSFGRKAHLMPELLDVRDTIRNLTVMFRRTLPRTIKIVVDAADSDACLAFVDRAQLESALLNLVVNASDAMPTGGILTLSAGDIKLEEKQLRQHGLDLLPGHYCMIAVADTGTGIPKDVLARVFDPFFTTKRAGSGSGLGLSMVQGFVKQSGGDVQIDACPDRGTTVTLYFEYAQENTRAAPIKLARPDIMGGGECILVVEDDDAVRQVTVATLRGLGYRILEAADGEAGIEVLTNCPEIRLMLSDVVLPGAVQGPDLANRAAVARPDVAVILMSGYHEVKADLANLGVTQQPVLTKPIPRTEFDRHIRQALRAKVGETVTI